MRRQVIRGSSQIESWGYGPQSEVLEVKYGYLEERYAGKVFQYAAVPEAVVVSLFQDEATPGQGWFDAFRKLYRETEVFDGY